MEEHNKLIVVPWDFTHVAEHALAHAVKISRMIGNEVCLLHIIDAKIKPADESAVTEKLVKVAEENGKKFNMHIASHLSKGTIFNFLLPYILT